MVFLSSSELEYFFMYEIPPTSPLKWALWINQTQNRQARRHPDHKNIRLFAASSYQPMTALAPKKTVPIGPGLSIAGDGATCRFSVYQGRIKNHHTAPLSLNSLNPPFPIWFHHKTLNRSIPSPLAKPFDFNPHPRTKSTPKQRYRSRSGFRQPSAHPWAEFREADTARDLTFRVLRRQSAAGRSSVSTARATHRHRRIRRSIFVSLVRRSLSPPVCLSLHRLLQQR